MLLLGACSSAYAQSRDAKVVKFKLEDYGWKPFPRVQGGEMPGTYGHLITIDSQGRVLVGYVARSDLDLATREHPELSFHILRFTPEGKIDLSVVLSTDDYFANALYLGPNDQLFVRANDKLQMLIAEKRASDAEAWKVLSPCSINCWIHQSPSRRTLIVSESRDTSGQSTIWPTADSSYAIFDASSLEPREVQTCKQIAFYAQRVTDEFAYWPDYDRDDDRAVRFPFCDVEHYQELPLRRVGLLFPLNDETFLLLGAGEIEIAGSDGHVKLRREMHKGDIPIGYLGGTWETSDEAGDRFAFLVSTWRGGSRFLDIGGKLVACRVLTYSANGQELVSVPVSTTYHRNFGFSLSPDGHRVAILDEDVVTVVDIP